ncbi:protease inhibitor Inh/omp19 family protein [Azorhizobium sp. AG788]|uniref:protease inhibitor Inh/omp19 family protein n=1 Tax=Azorhizobium sp. AG788 TaxID=2183897 RepID=UPI00313907D6
MVALRWVMVSALVAVPATAWAQSPPPGLIPGGGAKGAPKAAPAAKPSTSPAPKVIDPALRADVERRAGTFTLTSADGERACPLVLKTTAAGPGFALAFAADGCPVIPFTAQVVAWLPDPSGSIRLLSAPGRTVVEFTEGAAGTYEALREGDGVYFIATPTALQEDVVHPEEMLGEWDLSRAAGTPLCRWIFTDAPVATAAFAVRVGPGCEPGLAAFNPVAWRLEGGNVLVTSGSGASTLRFARQEDGGWAKVPERGRPLLMSRP